MGMADITEGEVAVYDRQLRLWGVQAQQRLLKSKVLIWGLEGSNVETCKNLILAGVVVTIRDHRGTELADVAFNYFLRAEDVGRNRAECAAVRFQEMNPLCTVSASASPVQRDVPGLCEALKGFDTVCVGLGVLGWDLGLARAVNDACRQVGASFFLSVNAGEMALFISDLKDHTVQEYSSAQGAPEAPKREPELFSFPSFREWMGVSASRLQQDPKVDPAFILFRSFFAFLEDGERPLENGAAARFETFCGGHLKAKPQVTGVESLAQVYSHFFVEPLVHVASITGGLLAQEVIKAITKRDQPLLNTVLFNAHASVALVEHLPAPEKANPKKRKAEEPEPEVL